MNNAYRVKVEPTLQAVSARNFDIWITAYVFTKTTDGMTITVEGSKILQNGGVSKVGGEEAYNYPPALVPVGVWESLVTLVNGGIERDFNAFEWWENEMQKNSQAARVESYRKKVEGIRS